MPYIGKSPEFGVRERFYFTQTSAGATSISGFDDNGTTLRFTDGNYVDVYLNGVLLVDGVDYGTSTANTISSLSALADEDVIEVVAYDVFNLAKNQAEVTRTRYYKTASGSETSISGNDDDGVAISFPAGAQLDVSLNGVSLVAGTDYNTSTANTISGLSALSAGQVIEIVKYEKFVVSDTVSKAQGGTFTGGVTMGGTLNVTGASTLSSTLGVTGKITSTAGITFGSDTAATNVLDDYEYGTWIPSIGGDATYGTVNHGRYTKIGNIVSLNFTLQVNLKGTGSNALLSGLPFTSEDIGWVQTGCVSYYTDLATTTNFIALYVSNNSTTISFVGNNGNNTTIALNGFAAIGNSTLLTCSLTYRVA